MRAFFGFLQFAFGIGGFIALFNGQWLAMIGCWLAAFLVGWIGNQAVRATMGVSQSGQEAMNHVPQALNLIDEGKYTAAEGVARSAVSSFRMGGDGKFLCVALTVYAVALSANMKFADARKAADEAAQLAQRMPPQFDEDFAEIRTIIAFLRSELAQPNPSATRIINGFDELNTYN